MPLHPRPAVLAAVFAILFAVIANLAWATAITTTSPWYDASVSLTVYAIGCVVPALLAMVLVTSASRHASDLEASLRQVDRRVALVRAKLAPRAGRSPPDPTDVDLEEPDLGTISDGLTARGSSMLISLEKKGHDTLVPVAGTVSSSVSTATTEALRQRVGERIVLREALARVWATAAGPVGACLLFLAIAGPMLPGSNGFAAAHYQLNTTLVLFLSYGLAPLVAWAVVALGLFGTSAKRTVT
jgi:hypothetical protein